MADTSLDIVLRILTQQVGPQKAAEVVKQVKEETARATASTKDYTKASEKLAQQTLPEVEKATQKTIAGKRQLHGAMRGLALQFPLLRRAAELVLNPISLSVGALVGAFQIWKWRVDSLTKSLGGLELPNVSADEIGRIQALASAFGDVAVQLNGLADKAAPARKDMEALVNSIRLLDQLRKAAGLDTGSSATRAEAGAREDFADVLEAEGRRKLAAAGTPGSAAREAVLLEQERKLAEAAQAQIVEQRDLLGLLAEARGGSIMARLKAQWRLGQIMPATNERDAGAWFDAKRAVALENIASHQGVVDRYQSAQMNAAARAGRRDLLASGQADLAEAARFRDAAGGLRGQAAVADVGAARGRMNTAAGNLEAAAISGNLAGAAVNILELARNSAAMKRASDEAIAEIRRVNQNQSKVP